VGAILLSLAGNAVSHLIAAHLLAASWLVVLVVGAVPPVVMGLVVELAVLRTQVDLAPSVATDEVRTEAGLVVPGSVPRTEVRPGDGPRYESEDELLQAARSADEAYRAAHGGKPITRDALREALRVGGTRASELLRQLRHEAASPGRGE
jgi:hypothetical protein